MTGTDLTIIVPIFRRTKNIVRLAESVDATVPDARLLFVVSDGDVLGRAGLAVEDADDLGEVLVIPGEGGEHGDYSRKINAGYRHSDDPLLFTGADDIVFQPGWYEAAAGLMDDVVVGVVGTVDDCNGRTVNGTHSTHTLVARWYADNPGGPADQAGAIYHEGYAHEYCDDELVQVAISRASYAHAFAAHVSHIHMLLDPGLDDEVYRHARNRTHLSRRVYRLRRRLWEGG